MIRALFLHGRNPHHVTGVDHLYRITPPLYAALARGDDEDLTERMGVPPRTRARFERHGASNLRLPTHGGLYVWEFEKGRRELKVRVEGQLVFNGTNPMLNAAVSGLGLAYVPEDLAQPYVEAGTLKRVLEDWCEPFSGYHLYYPSRRQSSPAFALLVEALRYRA